MQVEKAKENMCPITEGGITTGKYVGDYIGLELTRDELKQAFRYTSFRYLKIDYFLKDSCCKTN